MLREEKNISALWGGLLLAAVFLVIYFPLQLHERELYWQEGYYAVQALEMPNLLLPITVVHGEVISNSFPLYPWLTSLLIKIPGLSMELALRGLSVFCLGIIALIVWRAARSAGGVTGALVAVAMLISCNITMDKVPEGYPLTLTVVFLLSGWLVWFGLGFGRGDWNHAWMSAMVFGGLAFYTGGFQAILYFLVPFIFMRRPLNIWRKINYSGFWIGLGVLVCFILLWGIPYIILSGKLPFSSFPVVEQLRKYPSHLLEFPLDLILRTLPWSILAWAPFCVALFRLDSTPIFSRFLRTIVISLLFVIWLNPLAEPRDLIILIPPLSILTGLNYWILTRRYGDRLIRVMMIPAWLLIIPAAIIVMFYFIPEEWGLQFLRLDYGLQFREEFQHRVVAVICAALLVLVSFYLATGGRQRPLWIWILLLTSCFSLFSWSLITPYRAQEHPKKDMGREMRQALEREGVSPKEIIYKSRILDLYNECYYMGGNVRKVSSLTELPPEQKTVYLISTEFPQMPERRWRNLLPERMEYRNKRLCLYQGTLPDDETP
jgi:hypothetical protein